MTAWEVNTKCVADSIARYAMSIKGMPFPRKPEAKKAMALMRVAPAAVAPKKSGKNSGKKYINAKGSMIPNNRKRKAVVTY